MYMSQMFKKATKINYHGFNMSLMTHPDHPSLFLGLIRQTKECEFTGSQLIKNIEKVILNQLHALTLDNNFNVIEFKILKDNSMLPKYESFTIGIEDCRILSPTVCYGVSLYTNPFHLPEICLCHYDLEKKSIERLIKCNMNGKKRPEKNWLLLKETDENYVMIHSYTPFTIINVNKETGNTEICKRTHIFVRSSEYEIHGGSCVWIPQLQSYFVLVRIVNNHQYLHYKWVCLDELYNVQSVSGKFRFSDFDGVYEMNISMVLQNERLIIPVSLYDKEVYVFETTVSTVYEYLNHYPMVIL